jgi:hypothetical protein
MLIEFFERPYRPPDKLPAAVRTLAVQEVVGAVPAERAFKATDHCICRVWRQVLVAAFAIRPQLKHPLVSNRKKPPQPGHS